MCGIKAGDNAPVGERVISRAPSQRERERELDRDYFICYTISGPHTQTFGGQIVSHMDAICVYVCDLWSE